MRRPTPIGSWRRAFTLIELLVVIAIVGVLIAIAIPVLGSAIGSARRVKCASNARQIVTAINAFSADNRGRLPENRTMVSDTEYKTWRRLFAESGAVPFGEAWACPSHPDDGPWGEGGYSEDGIRCVGDAASSYALNGHVLWRSGIIDEEAQVSDTAILRPSRTILLAESNRNLADLRVSPPFVANYYGYQPGPYAYWHGGKGVYTFQDGHVEVLEFLETGSPDCRWHNGRDLTDDPYVPQIREEFRPHDHPDWALLVPEIYR
jgi:prepilin-type N-terminal cleavage/methylation domain-containing protein/prepilin-type processing-associated H-X9-DG protein